MCVVDTRVWDSLLWWPWAWKRFEKAMEVLGCARLLPQQGSWPGCERQALWGRPGQETPATSLRIEGPEGSASRQPSFPPEGPGCVPGSPGPSCQQPCQAVWAFRDRPHRPPRDAEPQPDSLGPLCCLSPCLASVKSQAPHIAGDPTSALRPPLIARPHVLGGITGHT